MGAWAMIWRETGLGVQRTDTRDTLVTKCESLLTEEICNAWSTCEVPNPHKTPLERGGDLRETYIVP